MAGQVRRSPSADDFAEARDLAGVDRARRGGFGGQKRRPPVAFLGFNERVQ
jgi:hypothetical protein